MSSFTKNPFDLLGEPSETPDVAAGAPARKESTPAARNSGSGGNSNSNGNKLPARAPTIPRQTGSTGPVSAPHKETDRRRDVARPSHGSGQRGGAGGRGRQFDRHSGSHRDSDKKVVQSWGPVTPSVDEEIAPEAVLDSTASKSGSKADLTADAAAAATPEEPKEEPVKTLDEYLAEKAAANMRVRQLPPPRKPNEGTQWTGGKVLERAVEQDLFSAQTATKPKKTNPKPVAKPQTLDIAQTFVRPSRDADTQRSGRGGARGGARGGSKQAANGGRSGGKRSPRGSVPNLSDTSSFPVLA